MLVILALGLVVGCADGIRWGWRLSSLMRAQGSASSSPQMSDIGASSTTGGRREGTMPAARQQSRESDSAAVSPAGAAASRFDSSTTSTAVAVAVGDRSRNSRNTANQRPTGRKSEEGEGGDASEHLPSGDARFIRKLVKFRRQLYPHGRQLETQLRAAIAEDAPAIRESERDIHWMPVQCQTLGLQLRVRKQIVNEGKDKNAVYLVVDARTGVEYAYKAFGKTDDYSAEVGFLMVANHPLIVKPVCIERDSRSKLRPGLVLEYIPGSLSSMAVAQRPGTSVGRLRRMAAQLLAVLTYMHGLGFVHADLKPDNVLVRPNGDIVVIDFGYTIPLPNEHPGRGNPMIKAPELSGLVKGRLHEALDKWAYGMCLAAWLAHKYVGAYRGRDDRKYSMIRVSRGMEYKFGAVPKEMPEDLRQLLYLLTMPDPELRRFQDEATFQMLKDLPFFKGEDWDTPDKTIKAVFPERINGHFPIPNIGAGSASD